MRTYTVIEFLKLVRFDTCVLTACILFVPLSLRGVGLTSAFLESIPVLLICMCCFVLNDVFDIEKDQINHPNRPLPSGSFSKSTAMGIYLLLLTGTLVSTYAFVVQEKYYLYMLCLIVFTNYNHVVEDFPLLKNLYVALASVLPVLILRPSVWEITIVDYVAIALCGFILGREILMDVLDVGGDKDSLAQRLGQKRSEKIGFGVQLCGIAVLIPFAHSTLKITVVILLCVCCAVGYFNWIASRHRWLIIQSMKVQAISGLAFLV